MKIRFVMYPGDFGLETIYKRLFHLPDENKRAANIKRLLGYLGNSPTLPTWFLALPEVGITTHRPNTVRLNFTARDVDLEPLVIQLTPLSESERINYLKTVLAKACNGRNAPGPGDQGLQHSDLNAPQPQEAAPPNPTETPSSGEAGDNGAKAKKIRSASALYRR